MVSMRTLQATQTADFVRLFEYVQVVGNELGKKKAWKLLEQSVTQRRIKWYQSSELSNIDGTLVETAYELFFLHYLRIPADKVPIVKKTDSKIVIKSYNFCPTLEACKILGLDTRFVCKNAYERPTQAFFSQIDPKLRFERNYECIRPHSEYCEEIIILDE